MAHQSDEKILAVCKLRFDKNNAEKTHTCTLTETKLYIARGSDLKSISLQDISSIEYAKRINWKLIGFGAVVVLFALANYLLGMFPAQPESKPQGAITTKNWLAQADKIELHGLKDNSKTQNDINELLIDTTGQNETKPKTVLHGIPPQAQVKKDSPVSLAHPDSLWKKKNEPTAPSMQEQLEWEESKNNISMAIAMVGAILIYFGFKKKSFIRIITTREDLYLRVYIVTDEYQYFVNLLNNKVGYVGIKNK